MPGNFKKEDLRTVKTRKALMAALPVLLKRRKFSKITVFDICEEALVSRTAFYAHYFDKYDLMGRWLHDMIERFFAFVKISSSRQTDDRIYEILTTQGQVLINLFEDVDIEQHALLVNALSRVSYNFRAGSNGKIYQSGANQTPASQEQSVLDDFVAGGLYNVISGWVKNIHKVSESQTRSFIAYVRGIIETNSRFDSGRGNGY